ncbi:MAG: hypothetical protein AABX70_05755 [Nanoarchaeota archaeon]
MRKAQLWSTDVLIGVAIFMGVIVLFYASLSLTANTDYPILKEEAQVATHRLIKLDSPIHVTTAENELNLSKLGDLAAMDYSTLRDKLGIRGEYCIYLEDSHGRIIPIPSQGQKKAGVGNPLLNVSGTLCGEDMVIPPAP